MMSLKFKSFVLKISTFIIILSVQASMVAQKSDNDKRTIISQKERIKTLALCVCGMTHQMTSADGIDKKTHISSGHV